MDPKSSQIMIGLASAAINVAVFQFAVPSAADVAASKPMDAEVSHSLKRATLLAAGITVVTAALLRSPTVFLLGASSTVGMNVWIRNANYREPIAGGMAPASIALPVVATSATREAVNDPDYGGGF